MPRLTKLGVGGFKSIRDLQPLELRPVSVFIGANGAGKTNLLSFFRLLHAMAEGRLQDHVGRAGGANTLLYLPSMIPSWLHNQPVKLAKSPQPDTLGILQWKTSTRP